MRNSITNRRHKGERRWGMSAAFPLKDSTGVLVIAERRRLRDRRLDNTTLEDRLLMFSGAVALEEEDNRHQ